MKISLVIAPFFCCKAARGERDPDQTSVGFSGAINTLNDVERRLRGNMNGALSTVDVIDMYSDVEGALSTELKMLKTLQEQHNNGDNEGFALTMQSLISEVKQPKFRDIIDSSESTDLPHGRELEKLSQLLPDEYNIPPEYANMIDRGFLDELIDRGDKLQDMLSQTTHTLQDFHQQFGKNTYGYADSSFFRRTTNGRAGGMNKLPKTILSSSSDVYNRRLQRMKKKSNRNYAGSAHRRMVSYDPNRRSRRLQADQQCYSDEQRNQINIFKFSYCEPNDEKCNCQRLDMCIFSLSRYDFNVMMSR